MDPKVKYNNYERLMGHARVLLPTLDRIAQAASVVAKGRTLSSNQQGQLADDLTLMRAAQQRFEGLKLKVAGKDSPEALFIRSAIGGGLNNLLHPFYIFSDLQDDPEFARYIKRQVLHPYFRLYNDIQRFDNDATSTGADITIGGDNATAADAYYKTAPMPVDIADVVRISEAVYGLVFSALLLADGGQGFSLDFTSRAEGDQGFIEVENADGVFADHVSGMVGRPKMQPTFLEQAFAAGMSVHDTTIRIPFTVARIA